MASWNPRAFKHGGYYMCKKEKIWARQSAVDAEIATSLLAHLDVRLERLARPATEAPEVVVDFDHRRDVLLRKRARIVSAIADDTITHADARGTLEDLAKKIEAVELARVQHETKKTGPKNQREELRETKRLAKLWAHATTEERREIVRLWLYQGRAHRVPGRAADGVKTWKLELIWKL